MKKLTEIYESVMINENQNDKALIDEIISFLNENKFMDLDAKNIWTKFARRKWRPAYYKTLKLHSVKTTIHDKFWPNRANGRGSWDGRNRFEIVKGWVYFDDGSPGNIKNSRAIFEIIGEIVIQHMSTGKQKVSFIWNANVDGNEIANKIITGPLKQKILDHRLEENT